MAHVDYLPKARTPRELLDGGTEANGLVLASRGQSEVAT